MDPPETGDEVRAPARSLTSSNGTRPATAEVTASVKTNSADADEEAVEENIAEGLDCGRWAWCVAGAEGEAEDTICRQGCCFSNECGC